VLTFLLVVTSNFLEAAAPMINGVSSFIVEHSIAPLHQDNDQALLSTFNPHTIKFNASIVVEPVKEESQTEHSSSAKVAVSHCCYSSFLEPTLLESTSYHSFYDTATLAVSTSLYLYYQVLRI
jgi:hypothetical protein